MSQLDDYRTTQDDNRVIAAGMEVFNRQNWKPITQSNSSSQSSNGAFIGKNVTFANPLNFDSDKSMVATSETLLMVERDGAILRDIGPLILSIEWYFSRADKIPLLNWIIMDVNMVGTYTWIERQLSALNKPV